MDIITVKFDIQVDNRTITQSTLLHDDIPGYNLLTLEFVLPPVNDNEDLILEEGSPCDNTDHILYKILKENASYAYSIHNYKHE